MKRIIYTICMLLTVTFLVPAQQNATFVMEGTVYDELGTPLPGVTIYIRDKVGIGTSSNIDGEVQYTGKPW